MKDDEIYTQLFQFSRPTFFKWKREKVPVMQLISKYFQKEDLEEFLQKGFISKFEKFEDYHLDPVFEDYVIQNLKRINRLDRSIFNIIFPTPEFITRHLKQLTEQDLNNLTVKNAKERFKAFLLSVKLSKIWDTEAKRKTVIQEVDSHFSDIEIYLIMKYPEKFIS